MLNFEIKFKFYLFTALIFILKVLIYNKVLFVLFLFLYSFVIIPKNYSQSLNNPKSDFYFATLEYATGKTAAANFNFPETNPQQSFSVSLGKTNSNPELIWNRKLNFPKTGFQLSYADLGNPEKLGYVVSFMPFIDFKIFGTFTNRLNLKTGLGISYFNKIYDPNFNEFNKAISTHFTWSFKSFVYYSFLVKPNYNLKLGVDYFHNSNGHVKLPNQGLNSFLIALSSDFNLKNSQIINYENQNIDNKSVSNTYFSSRFGYGIRAFSKNENTQKNVCTFSASAGKILNNTFKFGVGFYYRQYQDYYDYLKNDKQKSYNFFPKLNSKPFLNASNFGISTNAEITMNHIGVEVEFGINFFKPAYEIDWILNEGKYQNGIYNDGELTSYYKLKKLISSRLGLKYYILNTNKIQKNNFFIACHINANLGQADFSELSIGYVRVLNKK